jgi:hypothetical protein
MLTSSLSIGDARMMRVAISKTRDLPCSCELARM